MFADRRKEMQTDISRMLRRQTMINNGVMPTVLLKKKELIISKKDFYRSEGPTEMVCTCLMQKQIFNR